MLDAKPLTSASLYHFAMNADEPDVRSNFISLRSYPYAYAFTYSAFTYLTYTTPSPC